MMRIVKRGFMPTMLAARGRGALRPVVGDRYPTTVGCASGGRRAILE
ncbi:hypothetical protein [Dactylosporangium sp. CA-092794]